MPIREYDLRCASYSLSIINKTKTWRKGNYLKSCLVKERQKLSLKRVSSKINIIESI